MSDIGNKAIFAKNLKYYMEHNQKTRKEMCRDLGVSYSTFSDWYNAKKYPRIDKIELLANYFGVEKSDLIESHDKEDDDVPYYINPKTRQMAQEIYEDENLQVLFDASRNAKPEDILAVADILKRMQNGQNNNE